MKTTKKESLFECALNHRVQLSSATLLAVIVGCSSMQVGASDPIKVFFTGSCPTAVDNFVVSANSGDLVQWQATNPDSTPSNKPFKVYFDPFRGPDISTNSSGLTHPPKMIRNDVPVDVLYKYSIVAMDPNDPQEPMPGCKPLDPFLRVY